jgi:hypothetical protein
MGEAMSAFTDSVDGGVDEKWGEAYKTQTVAGLVDEAASGAMPLMIVDILELGFMRRPGDLEDGWMVR